MSEVYLRTLYLPDDEEERYYLYGGTDNRVGHPEIWRSVYPFGLLAGWQERTPPVFRFEPVTIFCGSNGCGKSTLLNVIAEMLCLPRKAAFNTTEFFREYVDLCEAERTDIPRESKIITSDDIFDRMQHTRIENAQIDDERRQVQACRRADVNAVYRDSSLLRLRGLQDYARWKEDYDAIYQNYFTYLRTERDRTCRWNQTENPR